MSPHSQYIYNGKESAPSKSQGRQRFVKRDQEIRKTRAVALAKPQIGLSQLTTSQHQHYESFASQDNDYSGLPKNESILNNNTLQFDHNIYTMSLAYENRGFANYPTGTIMEPSHDPSLHQHHQRYPSPPQPISDHTYTSAQLESALDIQMPELPLKDDDVGSPGRSKPLVKPDREVTKGEDGRFVCSWVGCTEQIRSFNRKCEWSKHMDKHDRPYKCPEDGCEKLPGFTYSGGLLRHQREVHNLHGGPRKQLNCPHHNCKRNSGKGFSRQENLNEHLRRVHTIVDGETAPHEETEEEGSERAGMKRKRTDDDVIRDEQAEMRDNYTRLAQENHELRCQLERQDAEIAEMRQQLQELTQNLGGGMQNQAPQALM